MTLHKLEGIVLRRQEVRETSVMLSLFTRSLGKVHGLVKGVRGARAAVPWYLEPLTLQSMVLYERRRSSWALISSCDLVDPFDAVRRDFVRTAYGSYALDLTDGLTGVGDPHPEIFDLLLSVLRALGGPNDPSLILRWMELHLLRQTGHLPELSRLPLSPRVRALLQELLQRSRPEELPREESPDLRREIRLKLQGLLRGVLERELKSRNFLQALGLDGEGSSSEEAGREAVAAGSNR